MLAWGGCHKPHSASAPYVFFLLWVFPSCLGRAFSMRGRTYSLPPRLRFEVRQYFLRHTCQLGADVMNIGVKLLEYQQLHPYQVSGRLLEKPLSRRYVCSSRTSVALSRGIVVSVMSLLIPSLLSLSPTQEAIAWVLHVRRTAYSAWAFCPPYHLAWVFLCRATSVLHGWCYPGNALPSACRIGTMIVQ
jgi:hypothetical protein